MEENDETTNVRRTRSGKIVMTPTAKATPKTPVRKTRKKTQVVEVEVSEEEDQNTEPSQIELERDPLADESQMSPTLGMSFEGSNEVDASLMSAGNDSNDLMDSNDLLDSQKLLDCNTQMISSNENSNAINSNSMEGFDIDFDTNLMGANSNGANMEDESALDGIHNMSEAMDVNEDNATDQQEQFEAQSGQIENSEAGESSHAERNSQYSDDSQPLANLVMETTENAKVNGDSEQNEDEKQNGGDPDAENISEDELPAPAVAKVPETEEVSDEELPGPKRAELPADTEVVSEDELPSVKKEGGSKRKLEEGDYDPGSPTSESEAPTKKPALDAENSEEKEVEKQVKPKKLPELDKYWKAVNDDPTDFTGWTYLLQYVDQENDMEAAREAYDAFLSHYPYCYGYWRKYADYEKRKGNKKKCEEVFERGLKAIPLSVDLWIHYLTYVKTSRPDDEDYIRSQFERAITACGLEFRSDRLWESYIKWETEAKRFQQVTAIYDRLLATPTQGYTQHFDNFQEHIAANPPNKVVEVDEFLALRKEVRQLLKHENAKSENADNADVPPGDEDTNKMVSSDEETKSIRERIISIRRKIHKNTVNAVTARWNYEEGIKRPYFHVKPLERCQLKNWQDYLDYEIEQGDHTRIIVLFERCLIACALYEEFWLKFVHYLENLKDPEQQPKIRDVYERACTIHHLKKPSLHLQWAMFEESVENFNRAAEILVNLEKSVPNVLQVAYRRINLERRRGDFEKSMQLFEHYINNSKNKVISSNIAIKYSRFCLRVVKDINKATEILKTAITKDPNNARLYLQLIDLTLQRDDCKEADILDIIEQFLEKESADADQKVLFAQRKLEYLEDFGKDIASVQTAYEQYQKYVKLSKESSAKKKDAKSDSKDKKDKNASASSTSSSSYGNYGNYGASSATQYPYSGSQQGQYNYSQYGQGDQYQYQNWQYPQSGYGGYNQWGSYGGGYGY